MKVTQEKVSWFTGFCHNVGKTFAVLFLTRMKKTLCMYIGTQNDTSGKTFMFCRKSAKTVKDFSSLTFIIYSILECWMNYQTLYKSIELVCVCVCVCVCVHVCGLSRIILLYVTLRDLRVKLKKVKDWRMMEDLMWVQLHFTDSNYWCLSDGRSIRDPVKDRNCCYYAIRWV